MFPVPLPAYDAQPSVKTADPVPEGNYSRCFLEICLNDCKNQVWIHSPCHILESCLSILLQSFLLPNAAFVPLTPSNSPEASLILLYPPPQLDCGLPALSVDNPAQSMLSIPCHDLCDIPMWYSKRCNPAQYFGQGQPFSLKGHGNEADFLGFLHKSVRHRSLTLHFEPFRFWLRIRGDIRNRKTIPRLAESGSRQECL